MYGDRFSGRALSLVAVIAILIAMFAFARPAYAACDGSRPSLLAASGNPRDIAACHGAASSRSCDTITVPPGRYTWTSPNPSLVITKCVTLDMTGVSIINNTSGSGGTAMIELTDSSVGHSELKGVTFLSGTSQSYSLRLKGEARGKAAKLHDFTYRQATNCGGSCFGIRSEVNRGVWWNFTLTADFLTFDSAFQLVPFGNAWSEASTMGANDATGESNTYIEHGTFTNFFIQCFDLSVGSKNVIRYNTFTNCVVGSHGKDTGEVSHRHTEFYGNTFVLNEAPLCAARQQLFDWINLRGGTLVVTENTMADVPAICRGIGGRPAITLVSHNLSRRYNAGDGNPASGEIFNPCWGANSPPARAPGQTWPVPQQVGQGNDGTKKPDKFGSTNFTEPVYVWSNTGTVTVQPERYHSAVFGSLGPQCPGEQSVSVFIQPGRDYIVGIPKPGYTQYSYPHPLAGSSR